MAVHNSSRPFHLGYEKFSVFLDLDKGEAQQLWMGDFLLARLGIVAAGDLAAAFSRCPTMVPLPSRSQLSMLQPNS
jgi:hypothetical protein